MSLVTQVDSLAVRIAEEFNTVRTEISDIGLFANVDGGAPGTPFPVTQTRLDGGGP